MIKNKILMTEGIICAVNIHRQAMKYVSVFFILRDTFTNILFLRMTKHFMITFEITMSYTTGCSVVCFSFNLFQVSLSFHIIIYKDCIEIVVYY